MLTIIATFQVMPYSNGPTVKKLSKMTTLLLARNYIVTLTRSLEELKLLLQELSTTRPPTVSPPVHLHSSAISHSASISMLNDTVSTNHKFSTSPLDLITRPFTFDSSLYEIHNYATSTSVISAHPTLPAKSFSKFYNQLYPALPLLKCTCSECKEKLADENSKWKA